MGDTGAARDASAELEAQFTGEKLAEFLVEVVRPRAAGIGAALFNDVFGIGPVDALGMGRGN
jgi:hypothetical protein